MAKEPRREQSSQELKAEIARSRDQIARDLRAFRREIDIPRRIKRSIRQQPAAWITAAVFVGALVIFLPARRKTVYVEPKSRKKSGKEGKGRVLEAGFALGVLKFAATVLKPVLISFITKKVRGFTDQADAPAERNRNLI
jgi:hypothetical protein